MTPRIVAVAVLAVVEAALEALFESVRVADVVGHAGEARAPPAGVGAVPRRRRAIDGTRAAPAARVEAVAVPGHEPGPVSIRVGVAPAVAAGVAAVGRAVVAVPLVLERPSVARIVAAGARAVAVARVVGTVAPPVAALRLGRGAGECDHRQAAAMALSSLACMTVSPSQAAGNGEQCSSRANSRCRPRRQRRRRRPERRAGVPEAVYCAERRTRSPDGDVTSKSTPGP